MLRAYFVAGRPRMDTGSVASFEDWDAMVRAPVLWIAEQAPDLELGDPMKTVHETSEGDDAKFDAHSILKALREAYGDARFTCTDVVTRASNFDEGLAVVMDAIAPKTNTLRLRDVSKWAKAHRDRIIQGLVIRKVGDGLGDAWRVEKA
jgi:hypothetical protein